MRWTISSACEVIGAFVGLELVEQLTDGGPQNVNGSGACFVQQVFQLRGYLLDRLRSGL